MGSIAFHLPDDQDQAMALIADQEGMTHAQALTAAVSLYLEIMQATPVHRTVIKRRGTLPRIIHTIQ